MESIEELKTICQDSRPEKEQEILIKWIRKASIRLTWLILHTPLSSNQVTIISIMAGLVGAIFCCFDVDIAYLSAAICFYMFEVLDCSDGEIARYKNSQSMTGNFLDLLAHYFIPLFFYAGLSFGIFNGNSTPIVFLFCFMGYIGSLLKKLPSLTAWQVICVERLREEKRMSMGNDAVSYKVKVPAHVVRKKKYRDTEETTSKARKPVKALRWIVNQSSDFNTSHYFVLVALSNMFLPCILVYNFRIGIIELFFVAFSSMSFFNSMRLLIRFVREKKVESAYYDFFIDGKCKMDYWL